MDTQHLGIITLLRSALTGESLALPESFDWKSALNLIYSHHLTGLVLHGASRCGVPRSHPAIIQLTAAFCRDLQTSRNQMQKLQEVYKLFDANNIDYMPVKGAVLKSLYPRPEYRIMGDADVLIRLEQYETIQEILPALGLKASKVCDHEHTWICPELTLELHHYLIPSHCGNHFDYYRNIWNTAIKNEEGCGFHLLCEDHYIYLLSHFVKHYLTGTIIAKDICDFWIWRKTYPDMNQDYITCELARLDLLEFHNNLIDLLGNWFENNPATDITTQITRTVFFGGVSEDTNDSVVKGAMYRYANPEDSLFKKKLKWFFFTIFPNHTQMSYIYPVLKKSPVLLPIFWVVRWLNAIFRDPARIQRGLIVMKMDADSMEAHHTHLTNVGLSPDKEG